MINEETEETRGAASVEEVLRIRLQRLIDDGDENAVEDVLASQGGDFQALSPHGRPWLHLLLERGMVRAAQIAMAQCDVAAPDEHGVTPLMVAAARGYADSCAQLLSSDAYADNPTVRVALSVAVENQHANVCRLLISFDRPIGVEGLFDAIARDAMCDVRVLLDAGVSAESKLESGKLSRFAVHEAVGRPSILRLLIRNGASVNAKDSDGRTALALAAARGDQLTCDMLLDEEASLDIKDVRGRSAMFHACANEREIIIKRLLALGETVDTMDNARRTPLFYHVERGNLHGCRSLLRHGADIFHADNLGWTALHVAASLGHKNICRLLNEEFQAMESIDYQDLRALEGVDVFCKAVPSSSSWVAVAPATLLRLYSDLLANGAKNVQSKHGTLLIRDFAMNSLLHLTVSRAGDAQCAYILRCLQSIGNVPVTAQNCLGESPVDLAKQQGRTMIVEVLHALADSEELGHFRIELGGTISRSVGFPSHRVTTSGTQVFTECSRPRLAQLSRGIENGVYSCSDEIVWQVDNEYGDTVLHFFIREFCERSESTPAVNVQEAVLQSPHWLGCDARVLRTFLTKRNWEGKTPLHVAAEKGAWGFCTALIDRGAHAGEECSIADKRLLDPPNEVTHFWKAVNFAASAPSSSTSSGDSDLNKSREGSHQREKLVEYLLAQPDALPTHDAALADLHTKVYRLFPALLPLLLSKVDAVWHLDGSSEAKKLYRKLLAQTQDSSKDISEAGRAKAIFADESGVAVHKLFLETERQGFHVLKKFCVDQCVIESTGDTLLHLVATHGHASALPMLRYLLVEGAMDVNRRNKQFKTPLHVACEQEDAADTCLFLLSNGADVTASCQNVKAPDVSPWFTPLYCALWSANPSFEVIEMLLTIPMSIVEPHNPRLGRSDAPHRGGAAATIAISRWNEVLLRRLVEVHPGALPLFLDHFAVEVNRLNGGILYHFAEVRHACKHLDLVLQPTTTLARLDHKYSPSPCVTHPVIRNAIHLKWKLFGLRCHRQQLALYVLMLVFFYLANVVLPKIDAVFNSDDDGAVTITTSVIQYKWLDFASGIDYAVAVCKAACWVLAVYHLIYVELYLEWRADRGRYWRSMWNLLDVGTYILMLATIPLEFCDGGLSVLRECLLGLLSVLLCINLMQALLVSSFFSVLIFTFARMCRVVAQFFFHYVLLLLGFAGGFHLLLHGHGPHVNFISTIRVVFLAMFGELNYLRNFYATDASPARNICGFLLLVLYVVVVMIVALNLLTALMTSEYEHVRSQAEERALLELAGALHRYEQWLGRDVVLKLYDSPRGAALLQACERRIPTANSRRGSGSTTQSSFHGLERWRRLSRHRGRVDVQSLLSTAATASSGSRSASAAPTAAMDAMADALAAELSRRVAEETAALRVEMAAKLQEIQDCVAAAVAKTQSPLSASNAQSSPRAALGRSASARDVAHVEAKLDALLALLHARLASGVDQLPASE